METNENKDTTYQSICNLAKPVQRGKFIAINTYTKKIERSQVNNLTLQPKELEKEEQTKFKVRKRKETIRLEQR